uniref:Alpha-1,3-mannosyl-glycoprotein 2-beta-N-acetylglucosaminyltransferase n=1 Tax=Panagrolaimus sp. JU765 TaxID=591449 RepID=A0AC34Q4N6_9BILA
MVFIFGTTKSNVTDDEIIAQNFGPLNEEVTRLEKLLAFERERIRQLQARVDEFAKQQNRNVPKGSIGGWPEPIGVLVFVCNRAEAIRNHLQKLLAYRTNPELFPIIVSQDCDSEEVAQVVKSFGSQVQYIKHVSGEKANIQIPMNHHQYTSYYRISRHYKLGLDHIFNELKLGSVIITEDDLDISPDFYDYFSGTRWLLDADKTLYCVSAWNDNGRSELIDLNANTLLYRSDFFSGLGWMLTKELWQELGIIWPIGFWDDWIRDPARRQNRSCIRPEIPRTSMTSYGQKGASKGLFFEHFLKKIISNDKPANFSQLSLDYLLKKNYDGPFIDQIYGFKKMTVDEVVAKTINNDKNDGFVRIEYSTMHEYTEIARKLHIMIDTKAGVPRTAYHGIVTCFINGIRIYVAPNDPINWIGYDVKWEPPQDLFQL